MNLKLFRPNMFRISQTEEDSMGNKKYLSVLFVVKVIFKVTSSVSRNIS